jgi:predicted TIM-barrel fold metal-dependent hydrolase
VAGQHRHAHSNHAAAAGTSADRQHSRPGVELRAIRREIVGGLPSEYWRRQCRATFQFDRIGTKLIEDMGVETLMWGSDYPHPDGIWPDSSEYIEKPFGHLPAEVTYKITCENAGKFYGLIN